ncbi:MAG: SRPBCC domain-containing protein [Nocardioidaceae bacterium]
MTSDLATLQTIEGKPGLRFERRLAHPPEKVWRAVTDPAQMKHWFPASVETELRAGASMRFSFGEDFDLDGEYADGQILELDPLFYAALHGDIRSAWPTERTERLERKYAARLD